MLLQHSSGLAIRAAVFLAQQPPGKLSPVHEIAAHAEVSEAYLAKILQRLAAAGLVRSFRGPGKGMELGGAPETITLSSIVLAVQKFVEPTECVLAKGICSEENPCPLHKEWVPHRTAFLDLLDQTTLADLVRSVQGRSDQSVAPGSQPDRAVATSLGSAERSGQ